MYFFSINNLRISIEAKKVTTLQIFLVFFFIFLFFKLNSTILNFLPNFYFYVFSYIKNYLEAETGTSKLMINVFYDFSEIFFIFNIVLLIIFFLFSWITTKENTKTFLAQYGLFFWVIHSRLFMVSLLVFVMTTSFYVMYYGYQLFLLKNMNPPQIPVFFEPIKLIFKMTKTYPAIKNFWTQINALPKAQIIFLQINRVSYYSYWICQSMSTILTIWLGLSIYEQMNMIVKKD